MNLTGIAGALLGLRPWLDPADAIRDQQLDRLRVIVESRADIAVSVLDRLIETACQRRLTIREAGMADEAIQSLRQARDDLEAHRLAR